MKFFWVINGKRLKQGLLIMSAALIAGWIAFVKSDDIPVFSTSEGPRAISKIKTEQKHIALTFDLGWGDVRILPILKILKEKDVQATFFVSGSWTERHKDIIEKIVKANHEIGSHGFQHRSYVALENKQLRKDILLAQKAIKDATGKTTTLLRPPKGDFNQDVLKKAEALNYTVVHWSVNSKDWYNPGVEQIVENVVKPINPGDLVLMHASDSAKQTAKALPIIIDQLKDQGYSFATVTKLLSNSKTQSNIIK